MLPKFRSFVRPITRSFVRSFIQIIFVLPLCCRNSDRSFVRSFDRSSFVHSSYSSFIVRSWSLFIVLPDNLCLVVMLPKFRSFVRPIIRSFVRSFIVPIHRSSFVHNSYSSFIVRSYGYSPSLFTVTIHHYYSLTLFTIVTIQCYYSPSLLFIIITTHRWYLVTFSSSLFIITIHRLADHPNFNYSYIMLSSPPKTNQTHIPVIRTPVTVIFLPVRTSHLVTHPKFLQVEHA
jgi:hypothetical protein